jgi:hypothetical protein
MRLTLKHFKRTAALLLLFAGQALSAATPNASLENLAAELEALELQLSAVQISPDAVCAPLMQANEAVRSAADAVTAVDENLTAPLQADAATFDTLDALVGTGLALSNEALRLSLDVQQLDGAASPLTIKDGITSMLQLSSDIGTMADRIGEMADRILVMSDNIDLMADRILETQELQSQNLVATTQTLLQTQENMLILVSVIETQSREWQYDALLSDGMDLYYRMQSVMFSPWSMSFQLRDVAGDVRDFREQVSAVSGDLNSDALAGTLYVDTDSMMQLYELSTMLTFVATAVDGYVIAIEGLQSMTSTPTLRDSMQSMLQLSGDIGLMADRIGDMADTILVMSDNIGMAADDIVAMQRFQSANLMAVQESVLGVQQMVIAITVEEGL